MGYDSDLSPFKITQCYPQPLPAAATEALALSACHWTSPSPYPQFALDFRATRGEESSSPGFRYQDWFQFQFIQGAMPAAIDFCSDSIGWRCEEEGLLRNSFFFNTA
jgi:hypothetical protein